MLSKEPKQRERQWSWQIRTPIGHGCVSCICSL